MEISSHLVSQSLGNSGFWSLKKFDDESNSWQWKAKPTTSHPSLITSLAAALTRYQSQKKLWLLRATPVHVLPMSVLEASSTCCHTPAFCHRCVLSKPGTCGDCKVYKCPGNLAQPAQPATQRLLATLLSLEPACTISPVWLHKLLHHNTTARTGSNPGYPRPEGHIHPPSPQTLPVTLEILHRHHPRH